MWGATWSASKHGETRKGPSLVRGLSTGRSSGVLTGTDAVVDGLERKLCTLPTAEAGLCRMVTCSRLTAEFAIACCEAATRNFTRRLGAACIVVL